MSCQPHTALQETQDLMPYQPIFPAEFLSWEAQELHEIAPNEKGFDPLWALHNISLSSS